MADSSIRKSSTHWLNVLAILLWALPTSAQVDQERAPAYFKEAAALCQREGGRLWGVSLCGPMVFAATRTIATNQGAPEDRRPAALGYGKVLSQGKPPKQPSSAASQRQQRCGGIEVTLALTSGLPSPKAVIREPEKIQKLRELLRDLPSAPGNDFRESFGAFYLSSDEGACGFPAGVTLMDDLVRVVTANGHVRFLRDNGNLRAFLDSLAWELLLFGREPEKKVLRCEPERLRTNFNAADVVVIARIKSVGRAPAFWSWHESGPDAAVQEVRYRTDRTFKGHVPTPEIRVQHRVVADALTGDGNYPRLSPALFSSGNRLLLFLKAGWITTRGSGLLGNVNAGEFSTLEEDCGAVEATSAVLETISTEAQALPGDKSSQSNSAEAPSLAVTIRPPAQEVRVGDPIPIEFTVQNDGRTPFEYLDRDYDRSGRMHEYQLVVQTETGETLPDFRQIWTMGGLAVTKQLRPGGQFSKTILLNRWALIKAPGSYRITGIYEPGMPFGKPAEPVSSAPITITVKPRTDAEMHGYIGELQRKLALVTEPEEKDKILERLAYTCSPEIVPILLQTWYEADNTFWQVEALIYYIPSSEEIKRQIMAVARQRGLANGMQNVLARYDVTAAEMFPLIERSLSPDNPAAWANGALAAQIYANDAFTGRLIELASDPAGPARLQAIHALALNRTDESVRVLRKMLEDPDEATRKTVADAIRSAYLYRGFAQGRPLLESDFDERFRRPQ